MESWFSQQVESILAEKSPPDSAFLTHLRKALSSTEPGKQEIRIKEDGVDLRLTVDTSPGKIRIGIRQIVDQGSQANTGLRTKLKDLTVALVTALSERAVKDTSPISVELVAEGVINPRLKQVLEHAGFTKQASRTTAFGTAAKTAALLLKAVDLYAQTGEFAVAGFAVRGIYEATKGSDYGMSFELHPENQ